MQFKIKICGLTNGPDARAAVDAGADAIGVNFYDKSPRCVTEQQVRQIAEGLGRERALATCVVGVFVNHPLDVVRRFAQRGGPNVVVQLHGDESPQFVSRAKLTLVELVPAESWRVIRVHRLGTDGLEALRRDLAECERAGARPDAVLVDAAAAGAYGGTGNVVPWPAVTEHSQILAGTPLILAGGLTPDNVAEAIRIVRPHAVDVASGVESAPGKKDSAKVRDFVSAAREAFAAL